MRHLKISENLYLLEHKVPKSSKVVPDIQNVNHIIIVDVSGSMYGTLPQLGNDLANQIKKIPEGDTVSFGWFSGEGDYRFVLKGFKISSAADRETVEKTVRANLHSRGTTCFSEILADTELVISDLAALGNTFSLVFLTDGYPVVSNYQREINQIDKAIRNIEGKVTSALLVGYGDYYNKELMATMSEKMGASLVHSEDLPTFSTAFNMFMEESRDASDKISVVLDMPLKDKDIVFSVQNRQINLYAPNPEGVIKYAPSKKSKQDNIYILTDQRPLKTSESELLNESRVKGGSSVEPLVKAAYAAACILTQKTKTLQALDVLAVLGDKAVIDAVNNSFTNAEYGKAEALMTNSVFYPSRRLKSGWSASYIPSVNAFCLLDVVNDLLQDDNAFFYPTHEAFNYKRIGRGSKPKEGYPTFKYGEGVKCPLKGLSWHQTQLNLSITSQVKGSIELKEGYEKFGFQKDYPTYVFRNYALVKDGFLNCASLPVSLSLNTFNKFVKHGIIDPDHHWTEEGVYVLHLDRVPVINRGLAEGKTSATELFRLAYKEVELQAKIKALKFLKGEEDESTSSSIMTEEQTEFLKQNGITGRGFNPPTEKQEAVDFYMAKEFDIKIKGHSTLPKIVDVQKKISAGKALTVTDTLVNAGIQLYEQIPGDATAQVKKAGVVYTLMTLNKELFSVRRKIQETKFAVILGKAWFAEFNSREENTLEIDGHTFTLSVREIKVEI